MKLFYDFFFILRNNNADIAIPLFAIMTVGDEFDGFADSKSNERKVFTFSQWLI